MDTGNIIELKMIQIRKIRIHCFFYPFSIYRFIVYKNETSAATAVETFDNLKIGGKFLRVQISKPDRDSDSTQRSDRGKSISRSESQHSSNRPFSERTTTACDYPIQTRRESPERNSVSRAQRQGDSDDEFTEIKYEPAVGTRIESKTRISSGRGILLRSEEKKS
jgi:RNA recognition motif-containing protein